MSRYRFLHFLNYFYYLIWQIFRSLGASIKHQHNFVKKFSKDHLIRRYNTPPFKSYLQCMQIQIVNVAYETTCLLLDLTFNECRFKQTWWPMCTLWVYACEFWPRPKKDKQRHQNHIKKDSVQKTYKIYLTTQLRLVNICILLQEQLLSL